MLLPGAELRVRIGGVIDAISADLPVGFLRRFPLHQHGAGAQHARLHVQRRRRRRLFAGAGLHRVARRAAPDVVHRHDAELVLRVRAQPADAVARRRDAVHFLVVAVGGFGAVLDHVVGDGFRVPGVPGQGDAGGRRFRYSQRRRRFGES